MPPPVAIKFNLRLNFNATGGGGKFTVLRHMAEGSQICDLDLILMRQGARSRIKIQFIEFLCDMGAGNLVPSSPGEGWGNSDN